MTDPLFVLQPPNHVHTCIICMQEPWMNPHISLLVSIHRFKLHQQDRVSSKRTRDRLIISINPFWSDKPEAVYTYSLNGIECLVSNIIPSFSVIPVGSQQNYSIYKITTKHQNLFDFLPMLTIPLLEDSLHITLEISIIRQPCH